MTAGVQRPRAELPKELRSCLDQDGCNEDELARRLLAKHVSLTRHRQPSDAALSDNDWLVDAVQRVLALQFADEPWPISIPEHEFVLAVAKQLPQALLAERRLRCAAALDILRSIASGNIAGGIGP